MALTKLKGNLERILDKNLADLVRGIRNNKENEVKYIAQCIEEIKAELKQENIAVKANAVAKLSYLQMIGYDISWAGFNIIEVMSSNKFTFKRIGYLAASQSFHQDTEVLMLTTNMIRKDLSSQSQYDAGVTLSGLACFINQDLARDLANDLMTLLSSTKPYIRKKAVLLMYKVFLSFPDALRPAFPRLKEKLEDQDPGVQSAAVNVICELARKNPKNYLSLAPIFFKLMTSSTNNWMLIKIIKLFGALTPLEPRLGKKLIEPLTNLIHSTSAMSLLYECINTVIAVLISISTGMPSHSASIQLCVQKLRILIEDSDQNLKYLGLLAMSKILKTHPKSVQAHKDLILLCLDDKDESIRLRALDLLYGMVSKKNLMEIVKKLMVHMDRAEGTQYRDELLSKIIEICSQDNYHFITSFEWYISVLVDLSRMEGLRQGHVVASQLMDVTIRVPAIRPFSVEQMALLLETSSGFAVRGITGQVAFSSMCEVLYAAAWICGEFASHLKEPEAVLECVLKSKVTVLPGHIQAVFIHNLMKLYAHILRKASTAEEKERARQTLCVLQERLTPFMQSADLEVQERASTAVHVLRVISKLQDVGEADAVNELMQLFQGELNPVAPKAQRKVPLPDGLDLDAWINEPEQESDDEPKADKGSLDIFYKTSTSVSDFRDGYQGESVYEETEHMQSEDVRQSAARQQVRREALRVEQANNPHYLKASSQARQSPSASSQLLSPASEEIPVMSINLSVPLQVSTSKKLSDKYLELERNKEASSDSKKHRSKRDKKKKKKKDSSDEEETIQIVAPQVISTMELPEGARLSDSEDDGRPQTDPHRALNIDLDTPSYPKEKPVVCASLEQAVSTPSTKIKKSKSKNGIEGSKEEKARRKKTKQEKEEKVAPSKGVNLNDDLDFWLSASNGNESKEKKVATKAEMTVEETATSDPKKPAKNKKDKKEKKEKKSKKEKREKKDTQDRDEQNNHLSENMITPVTTAWKPLVDDKRLVMKYRVVAVPHDQHQVLVPVMLHNRSSKMIHSMNFNVVDSANARLCRGQHEQDGVELPHQLASQSRVEIPFAFAVMDSTMVHQLRGVLTYMTQGENGSVSEKLDFKLQIPCSVFLTSDPMSNDQFAELLASQELPGKAKILCEGIALTQALDRASRELNMRLVEMDSSGTSASLYSHHLSDHHLCILMKSQADGRLSIYGKSSNPSLASSVIEEMRQMFA